MVVLALFLTTVAQSPRLSVIFACSPRKVCLDETSLATASVLWQGDWKWLAGAVHISAQWAAHPAQGAQARRPDGLACPGLVTGSSLSAYILSRNQERR